MMAQDIPAECTHYSRLIGALSRLDLTGDHTIVDLYAPIWMKYTEGKGGDDGEE